jgi:hypothetical protein
MVPTRDGSRDYPPYRYAVSVVRRDAIRRWFAVAGGVAVLCLSPIVIGAWPVAEQSIDPAALRNRVVSSAAQPYQGYVETTGHIALPALPQIGDVADLLAGTTRIRTWFATPLAWRVAVLTATGEQDTYRTADGTFIWNYERNLVTGIVGELPIRLPWAADLTPPALAHRVLAAARGDPVSRLPPRRIAGMSAAGFRVTPQDAASTIGRIDVWAEPESGLPLRVEIGGRDAGRAVLTSRFLDVSQQAPDPTVIAPVRPRSAVLTTTNAPDVASSLNSITYFPLPGSLGGRPRMPTPEVVAGVGTYGYGLSTLVAVPLPGRLGGRAIGSAEKAGALPVDLDAGQGLEMRTSVLTTLIVWSGEQPNRQAFLLAGFVAPQVLERAGSDLLDYVRGFG